MRNKIQIISKNQEDKEIAEQLSRLVSWVSLHKCLKCGLKQIECACPTEINLSDIKKV